MILAMWSGPRNLSTAMMRSFANRRDVKNVMDEPLYASYLFRSPKRHPMHEEILKSQPTSYKEAINNCLKESPGIFFQKHMVQHVNFDESNDWMSSLKNFFLIRKPESVIPSFCLKYPDADINDLGFYQQYELYKYISDITNEEPPVVDATDIRNDPEKILKLLCKKLDIAWDSQMLKWQKGIHDYDGVWASHWYHSVHSSNCFIPEEIKITKFDKHINKLISKSSKFYDSLARKKIS